jgi:hypothetical protein
VSNDKRAADDAALVQKLIYWSEFGYGAAASKDMREAAERLNALSSRADGGKDSSDARLGAYVRRLHGMLGRQVEAFYDNIDAAIAGDKK